MFDAYNIRKIAPRLVLAVIGVNLSIYLCIAAVEITNIIGGGLGSLIREPFISSGDFTNTGLDIGSGPIGGIIGLVGVGGGGFLAFLFGKAILTSGAGVSFILIIMMTLVLLALLIALAILITVAFRYCAIILLSLVSPIAISMLVLPGTEKYFRRWWENFLKCLVVYPIIAAIFAVSDVMGSIFMKAQSLSGSDGFNDAVTPFVVVVVVYAPLFMIPFAFKFAGGFLGSIYDMANKNLYGRAKPRMDKWKENENSLFGRTRDAARRARENRGLSGRMIGDGIAAGIGGFKHNPKDGLNRRQRIRERYQAAANAAKGELDKERSKKAHESYLGQLVDGNDDVSWAYLEKARDGETREQAMARRLKERDPTTYNDTAQGRKNITDAITQFQKMERDYGKAAVEHMAAESVVSAPTFTEAGLKGEAGLKVAELASQISHGDSTAEKRNLADLRKKAEARADASKSSYSTHAIIQQELDQGVRFARDDKGNLVMDANGSPQIARRIDMNNPAAVAEFRKELNLDLMRSVHAKTSAGQRASSHDRSVQSDVEFELHELGEMLDKASVPYSASADGELSVDWSSPEAQRLMESDQFQIAMADMHNALESMRYAPKISGIKHADKMKAFRQAMDDMQNGIVRDAQGNIIDRKRYATHDAIRENYRNLQDELSGGGDPSKRGGAA